MHRGNGFDKSIINGGQLLKTCTAHDLLLLIANTAFRLPKHKNISGRIHVRNICIQLTMSKSEGGRGRLFGWQRLCVEQNAGQVTNILTKLYRHVQFGQWPQEKQANKRLKLQQTGTLKWVTEPQQRSGQQVAPARYWYTRYGGGLEGRLFSLRRLQAKVHRQLPPQRRCRGSDAAEHELLLHCLRQLWPPNQRPKDRGPAPTCPAEMQKY